MTATTDDGVTKKRQEAQTCPTPKPAPTRRKKAVVKTIGCLERDGDAWIEREFIRSDGQHIYFYQSFKTKRIIWLEPPTGDGTAVFITEHENFKYLDEIIFEPFDDSESDDD